jgi:hypothetical protein
VLENFTVADGTARITARAFAGSALKNVVLSSQLQSIGDKAFYGCENLAVVVFTSYYAPMLEEEYDTSYISLYNMPFTGTFAGYEGLGITPYYLWNAISSYNNFFYGSNFVDYIGHINNNVVMVKPANGKNYNTFVFDQYFTLAIEGKNALTQMTLNVIAIIEALPTNISLSDEAAVVKARAAYDQIPELEQKALVSNYNKLTGAESTIKYLKLQNEPTVTPPTTDDTKEGLPVIVIILIVIGGLVVLGGCGVFVYFKFLKGNKKKPETTVAETGENNNIEE